MYKQEIENNEIDEKLNEIGWILDEYDVEYPSESEIMMTINSMRPYVPIHEKKWKILFEKMISITKQSLHEISYMSSLFWIFNSIFLVVCLTEVIFIKQNPYVMIMVLAPIPTISGLIEVIKSKNTGMVELEMSFKFSLQEIVLSKMLVVGGFNFVINFIFTFSISFFNHDVLIGKMLLYWVTMFTVITAIALAVVSRFRHVYAITAGLIIWIAFGGIISQTAVLEKIENIPSNIFILVTVIASILIVFKIKQMYKRGVTCDFNH